MDKSTSDIRLARWLPIIEECAASGMPKKDWCREHNIELKKFYYWQRKARLALSTEPISLATMQKTTTPEFVKLPVFADNSATVSISFAPDMIITFNGITVGVANTASPELLSLIGAIANAK
ncbi:MAG: IS66 family insertion sequence element accessory protein TnpB [Lachnospiraceae bacterium]|nr:IS66 family insertion sequence element accessory protein TnpB [Lachnospiraceae bacterium]